MTEDPQRVDPDGRLISDAARGDREAQRELLEWVYPRVYEWALVQLGEPDEAWDLTQDTLVRLVRHLPSYRGEGRFLGWVFTVTRNLAVERHRKAARQRKKLERYQVSMDGSSAAPEQSVEKLANARVADLVKRFFLELPARQREVFALADLEGFGQAEIARMLGLRPGTVRANLFRARRAIRKKILEQHPELAGEYGDALS